MRIWRRDFGLMTVAGLAASRGFSLPVRPKLLVLVVLGQFRPDCLNVVWNQLPTGGIRRLRERVFFLDNCRHLASPFPSTSIATLACGCWPAEHGIVADSWFDRPSQKPVPASEEELLATTLASELAVAPHTRVYVAAMESSHAGIFAGGSGAQIYWMDERGRMVTRGESPDWLENFNLRKTSAENLHDAKWQVLSPRPGAPGADNM